MSTVAKSAAPTPLAYFAAATLKAFNTNKTSWIGLAVFLIVVVAAIFAPLLAPFDPTDQNIVEKLRAPTLEHWLGTDSFGRDTLSRLLYGARISLVIGVVSTLAAMLIGALNQRDYPMLQGMMVIYTLIVVLVNLLTDLAYGFVDPRVKLQ